MKYHIPVFWRLWTRLWIRTASHWRSSMASSIRFRCLCRGPTSSRAAQRWRSRVWRSLYSPDSGVRMVGDQCIMNVLYQRFTAYNLKKTLKKLVWNVELLMIYKPYIKRLKAFGFLGLLSHSGDLLLWVGVRRRASSFNILFSRTTEPILTKFGL